MRRRRGQRNLTQFFVPLISYGNEILFAHHARLLGPDTVGDEAAMLLGFPVVRALMAKEVMGGQLTGKMKKISRHQYLLLVVEL